MSSATAWSSKHQVLDTLKQLSNGKRQLWDLDNTHFVQGDKPPPALVEDADEEMRLHFGDAMPTKYTFEDNTPPDLQGITNLLRLVKGSDEEGDEEETIEQRSNYGFVIRKGSNLNPEVKEFIPKSTSTSDVSVHSPENVQNTDPIVTDEKNVTKSVTEDLETKLKNDISHASRSNCFELKKQKNVAIATLLRLYAKNHETTPLAQNQAETIKLITPDYFENQNIQVATQSECSLPASSSPGIKSLTSTSHTSSSSDVKSEPILSTRVTTKKKKLVQDPAIKTSINKVNEWFGEQPANQTIKSKSPAVFIGPITYKAKEPSACNSPKIPDSEKQKITKVTQSNEYQPSNYAADLTNKYMDRVKSKKVKTKNNIWDDLEKVLKERDLVAIKKLEQGSENSSDSNARRRH